MSRRIPSLRARLTLINVALLAVALVVTACASVWGLRTYLVDRIDDDLHAMQTALANSDLTAETLQDLTGRGGVLHKFETAEASGNSYEILGALIDPDGQIVPVFGSGSVVQQQALAESVDDPEEVAASGDIVTVDLDGEPFRLAAVRLSDGSIVLGAGSLDTAHATVKRLIKIELFIGLILLVVLASISLATARRRLRPLEDMVETASAIAEGDMSRRVADRGPTSAEVEQLRTALNSMLQQIEIAFQTRERLTAQLRNFAADASHELRTPLASIQGYLQLYDKGMLTDEEVDRARERIRAETDRMARLVDQLLALARLDQQPELGLAPVDLAGLVRDAASDLGAVEPDRPVRIEVPDDPVVVRGDDAQLRQVVGNLLSNVRVHTPTDAAVTVTVTPQGQLRIADEGPGMGSEEAARMFDRFFRASPDRSDGSGLGLSIVQAVIEAHGGTVGVDTAPGEGTAVTVALPVVGD
ncbi:MAG TPA: HAMP domain-containing sensor histidine kinase [Nocardioidaceae bacterium]|nr:HAMP domain-containing sensor histidine kinase [Nocardioidaceae bacterium]